MFLFSLKPNKAKNREGGKRKYKEKEKAKMIQEAQKKTTGVGEFYLGHSAVVEHTL